MRFTEGQRIEAQELNAIIEAENLTIRPSDTRGGGLLRFIVSDTECDYHTSQPFMSNTITITKVERKGGNYVSNQAHDGRGGSADGD